MTTDELDRMTDRLLRTAFQPPPPAAFAAMAATVARSRPQRWPWLLAAAAVAIAALLWFRHGGRESDQRGGLALGAMWVAAYEHAMAQGFEGGSCCDAVGDLPQACQDRFATQLDIAAGPVRVLGCYCGLSTGDCMTLLARNDGTPVCVFVVSRAADPLPVLPVGSRYDLARRELGEVVLYALSASVSAATVAEFLVP
jgi:hypothetical protein